MEILKQMVFTAAGQDEQVTTKQETSVDEIRELMNIHEQVGLPCTFYDLLCGLEKFPFYTRKFRHTVVMKMKEFGRYEIVREYPNMKEAYKNLFRSLLITYEATPPIQEQEEKDLRYIQWFLCTF
jgi:hypothetical protein